MPSTNNSTSATAGLTSHSVLERAGSDSPSHAAGASPRAFLNWLLCKLPLHYFPILFLCTFYAIFWYENAETLQIFLFSFVYIVASVALSAYANLRNRFIRLGAMSGSSSRCNPQLQPECGLCAMDEKSWFTQRI